MKDQDPQRPKNRAKKKRWLIGSLIVIIFLGALAGFGKYYYPKLNAERLLSKARAFHGKKDYHSAAITAQRVLQIDQENVAAVRMLLQITDEMQSPTVLIWKHRLAEIEPGVVENHLAVAEEALDQGQPGMAEKALAAVRETAQGRARYHALSGRAAIAAKDVPRAEAEYAEAARLEPANGKYQLQWQIGRLRSSDPEIKNQAREALAGLLDQPEVFAPVSRLLIADALSQRDANRALKLAEDLHKTPVATFGDHLVYLDVLRQLRRPNYASYLAEVQEEAVKNPEHVYALILWLNDRQSALLAIDWAKRLPAEMTARMPVAVAVAQCYARLKDWTALKPLVSDAPSGGAAPTGEADVNWGDHEFMRLAFMAAVRRVEGDIHQGKAQWNAAVKSASNRPVAIAALARFAVDWGWDSESTELLWKVARESSDKLWALEALYRHYEQEQATSNLQEVAQKILEIQPGNPDMQNNLAMLNLLLGIKTAEAVNTARDLHQREPQNASYLTTYALGLLLQGYAEQAAEIIRKIPPEKRKQRGAEVYSGVILAAVGAKEEAREYLELAKEARLLPEEKKLVAQAWERLEKPPATEAAAPAP